MTTFCPECPIGIFDSGVGGLTVAGAIRKLLPGENIIYFGDIAHLPYGDKSQDSIKYYSIRIADFLLSHKAKVILIACNTASATAYDAVLEHVKDAAMVLNVIDPTVAHICRNETIQKVGVIGTKGTINSGTYPRKILTKKPEKEVVSLPTPLFVPMIEEGFIYDDISNAIIRSYLSQKKLEGIDSLILGCTHYPVIKNQIRKFFDFSVKLIDSSEIVALHLKKILAEKKMLNTAETGEQNFYVSDYTTMFDKIAQMFFDDDIKLKKTDLWK